jgi:hypothetical protein
VDVSLASCCPEDFLSIGVPIGTDAFVRNFVTKTCRTIIDDVEKLDAMQDGFFHYQLLRFSLEGTLKTSQVLPGYSTAIYQFSYFAR